MRTSNKEVIIKRIYGDKNQEIGYEEVAELVRCKDCKWWDREEHNCVIRDSYGWDYKPTDYCSYAERKEHETSK